MTATGYDAQILIRTERETRKALDEVIPDDLSRSEVLREKIDEIIDSGREEIDDELLREIDKKRAERETDERVRDSFILKRTRKLAESLQGDNSPLEYIEYPMEKRREEARNLPEELMPEKAVEYVDCMLVLIRAYDYDERRALDGDSEGRAPVSFGEALESVYRRFPEGHEERTAELVDAVDLPEEEIGRLHDATDNGILDPFVEDDELTVSFGGDGGGRCPNCGSGLRSVQLSSTDATHKCPSCRQLVERFREKESVEDEDQDEERPTVVYADGGGIPDCPECDAESDEEDKVQPQLKTTEGIDIRCPECATLYEVRGTDSDDRRERPDIEVMPVEECPDCTELVACNECAEEQYRQARDDSEPMTDGGIPTETARDAQTDDRQSDLVDIDSTTDMTEDDRETTDMPTEDDVDETTTVRARLRDVLDGEIHAMQTTHRYGGAVYLSVVRSCDWSDIDDSGRDIPVLDMRTVIVDLKEGGGVEDVRVTDNGIWIRRDKTTASNAAQMFARASSEIDGMDTDGELILDGSDDVDVGMLLDAEMTVPDDSVEGQATHRMEEHPGISPERSWGYGGDAPPEAFDLARRMRQAGLEPSDHLIRLWWGQKKPHSDERENMDPDDELRPVAELKGNYGVEVRQRDDGLVLVDVDDPEAFDALDVDLPESYSVSSPHGSDERRHVYLVCGEKDRVKDEIGGWGAYQEWGELYVGNPFVVGPGSQLSAYGCDNGEHERGDADACDECASEDGGFYGVVRDAPIREVDAETLVSLVSSDDDGEETVEGSEDDDVETCDSCGAAYPEDDEEEYLKDAGKVRVCRGGCE